MRNHVWTLWVVLVCSVPCLYLAYQYVLDRQSIRWHDYMKVRDGMTRSEVEHALGPPRRIEAGMRGKTEVRWIGRNKGMICVEFDEQGGMVSRYFIEEARDYTLSFYPRVRE